MFTLRTLYELTGRLGTKIGGGVKVTQKGGRWMGKREESGKERGGWERCEQGKEEGKKFASI